MRASLRYVGDAAVNLRRIRSGNYPSIVMEYPTRVVARFGHFKLPRNLPLLKQQSWASDAIISIRGHHKVSRTYTSAADEVIERGKRELIANHHPTDRA
jgi:hypothetical protein